MKRNSEQHHEDDDILNELDRFVIEAIDTLIATSKQVKTVRQHQRKERQESDRQPVSAKVTPLKPRPRPADSRVGDTGGKRTFDEEVSLVSEDNTEFEADDLSGMTPRQRERAEAFASWLMQQDNYPVILQHIEELLAPFDDDPAWHEDARFEEDAEDQPAHVAVHSKPEVSGDENAVDPK